MPDFSTLLQKQAGQAKRPPVLDAGNYPGIIKGYELGDQNKNKTPYVRFSLVPTAWPEGAEPQLKDDGTPIDLSTKSFRRDFYLTDDALYRLDELLRGLNISMEGQTYLDVLPQTINAQVLIEVQQQLGQTNNELFNQVGNVKALA